MKKFLFLGMALTVSMTLLLTACKKEVPPPVDANNTIGDGPKIELIPNAVTDVDGNSYDAVQIGEQVWMAENLVTTHYANGTLILEAQGAYSSAQEPLRYTTSCLYNWPAVMHGSGSSSSNPSHVQGVCPDGWHVPSDAEWTQLTTYVGGFSEFTCDGSPENIAKALAINYGWGSTSDELCAVGNNAESNNATGFSAARHGLFRGSTILGPGANFWTCTATGSGDVYYRSIQVNKATVIKDEYPAHYGLNVRCVRN